MEVLVIKLTDISFLSAEDLEREGDLGEKIIRQFSFLPGDLKVTISDGFAHIEYSSAPPEKLQEAMRLADQAAKAARRADFKSALGLYEQALQANPAQPDTHRDLAMVHYELGDLASAKNALIDAIHLAAELALAHKTLGECEQLWQRQSSAVSE